MKGSYFLSVVALAARVALAAMPPACLLHAINTQDDPTDMGSICGNNATEIQSAIASLCSGDAASPAQSAFIATCSVAGKQVASYSASASATRSGSFAYTTAVYNSSCHCTQTIVTSNNANAATGVTKSSGPAATGSSGAAISSGFAAMPAQPKIGGYAAAAIALVGAVAAL